MELKSILIPRKSLFQINRIFYTVYHILIFFVSAIIKIVST